MDGKYILTGGEDDLVQVWSMEDRKVIAWGEGHNSWVSLCLIISYHLGKKMHNKDLVEGLKQYLSELVGSHG